MPIYEYRCPNCGNEQSVVSSIHDPVPTVYCRKCITPMRRRYRPLLTKMPMDGHFNASLGRWVNNEREVKDGFKIASEEATMRTGIEHRYVPVDPRDTKALGVTQEGLEEQSRRWHDRGIRMQTPPIE